MGIIESEYLIKNIHLVLSSTHKKKRITNDLNGRYSDCFAFIIHGTTDYTFSDGKKFRASTNDVLYLSKGSKYVMDITSESYKVIYIDFDFDTTSSNESQVFHLKNHSELETIFNSIKRKWLSKKCAYYTDCLSSLYKIYALIIQNELTAYVPTTKEQALNKAIKEIADNFSNPDLSISELADISQMSEGHFRRLFKSVYGISPIQYIKTMRIDYAKTLLTLHDYTMDEIAILSGFSNIYYFYKCFKAETEMTPTEYKNTVIKPL